MVCVLGHTALQREQDSYQAATPLILLCLSKGEGAAVLMRPNLKDGVLGLADPQGGSKLWVPLWDDENVLKLVIVMATELCGKNKKSLNCTH